MSINKKTIDELMYIFDVIFDAQEHPIFINENAFDAAFGAWISYELMNEGEVAA